MHRFYLAPTECRGAALTLTGREAHHALHVLRLERGERVIVLDGAGSVYHCEVEAGGRSTLGLAVVQKEACPPPPHVITLVQAVPKGKAFETVVQKASELGVSRIVPLLSERVVVRIEAESAAEKAEKWRQAAVEAVKQCGNPWLPQIDPPVSLPAYVARGEQHELTLIAALEADGAHPRQWFNKFWSEHQRRPRSLCVWVGPEGDFTPDELRAAKAAGALPVTLGPRVLRAETAAIYCLSVLNYELLAPIP